MSPSSVANADKIKFGGFKWPKHAGIRLTYLYLLAVGPLGINLRIPEQCLGPLYQRCGPCPPLLVLDSFSQASEAAGSTHECVVWETPGCGWNPCHLVPTALLLQRLGKLDEEKTYTYSQSWLQASWESILDFAAASW